MRASECVCVCARRVCACAQVRVRVSVCLHAQCRVTAAAPLREPRRRAHAVWYVGGAHVRTLCFHPPPRISACETKGVHPQAPPRPSYEQSSQCALAQSEAPLALNFAAEGVASATTQRTESTRRNMAFALEL